MGGLGVTTGDGESTGACVAAGVGVGSARLCCAGGLCGAGGVSCTGLCVTTGVGLCAGVSMAEGMGVGCGGLCSCGGHSARPPASGSAQRAPSFRSDLVQSLALLKPKRVKHPPSHSHTIQCAVTCVSESIPSCGMKGGYEDVPGSGWPRALESAESDLESQPALGLACEHPRRPALELASRSAEVRDCQVQNQAC